MVESGVKCSTECLEKFNEMKINRAYKYIIFKIESETEIIVEHLGAPDADYAAFAAALPANEPRFGVIDYSLDITEENPPRIEQKMTFIHWVPDISTPRYKMVASSSKEPFKRQLAGV
jgi:cofilin